MKERFVKKNLAKGIGDVAGCLVGSEREFLLDYTSRQYRGVGELVDLGCFLGSSTYAMALGLEINERVSSKHKRIFAYDRFEWNRWMDRPAERYRLSRSYRQNDCFVDEFKRQMGDKIEYIETVKGDLTLLKWESEKGIEYLFVDSMKDWKLCNCILEGFYPAMTPGLSLLHHQDFVFFHTYWIHLTMFRLRDYFEAVDHDYMGPSKVFRYTRELPSELLNKNYHIGEFSVEEIVDAFAFSRKVVAPQGHEQVEGAKILALIEKREFDAVAELLEKAKTNFPRLCENPVFQNTIIQAQNTIGDAA